MDEPREVDETRRRGEMSDEKVGEDFFGGTGEGSGGRWAEMSGGVRVGWGVDGGRRMGSARGAIGDGRIGGPRLDEGRLDEGKLDEEESRDFVGSIVAAARFATTRDRSSPRSSRAN